VDTTNDRAVWLTDTGGTRHLIAREGDLFDVDDDPVATDFRTISLINLYSGSGGDDGKATSLNDAGRR
jgi:hypothetical protein